MHKKEVGNNLKDKRMDNPQEKGISLYKIYLL